MLRTSHGRPAALTSLVLPALIQLCLILCEPANGQSVQCYSAVGCSVTDIIALGLPAEDCCVPGVNRINNGLYYQLVESPGCTPCMVYGFDIPGESMESPSFTAEESDSERYFLPIRRLKGMVDLVEELIVEVVPGTAVEGEDFVIETKNIRFSGETTSVVVTFREDGVALEEDETFVLRLSGSRQAFFVNTLAVTISDPEGIEISFTKHDYRGSERLQEVLVVLEANRRPATPVTMSVTSLIYSELGSQYDVEFVPDREQASEQDFSPEVQFVTFLPDGPANPSVTVRITNDEINEGEEVFAVIVELVEALDPSRVTIGLRNASLCRIMDDDQIFIGFEFDSYYYTETEDIVNNPTRTDMVAIYLVKSVESEQSFSVNVATRVRGTGGNGRNAIHNVDYSIGENDEQVLEFGPDQERVLITLYLFDDSLPELTEAAQLVISQDETSVGNFTLSDNATTTIFIMDDGDPVIAELSPDFAVVIESVGAIEFCLNVTVPGPQEPLPFDVAVLLETSSVSADEDDYEEVSIFNSPQLVQLGDNSHRMCFNVTINDDDLVEVTETFLLTATTVGEVPFQALPNVSVVSILDNDAARVEITPESITVPEDIGSVEICASVVSGQFDPSLDATVSYRVYTQRDTAGSEDFEAFLLVNSTAVDQLYTSRLCFFVSIIDDDLVESFESFRVIAELSVDPTLAVILSPNVSHITITDNDEVTIGFIPESSLVLEMNGTITVSVGVIAGQIDHGVTVEVRLFTEDLTATAQQDYSPVDCQLFFNSTTVVLHVRVGILTDSIFEDEEQFQVQIESRQDFVNLLPAESVVTIADNSPDALIGLEETHFLVREGDDIVDVCVRIVGTTLDRSVTITLVTSDETATSPGDYQQTVALLTFNSTVNRLCTTIEVVDDNVFESDEVFYVIIGDTNSSITISPESGVVTIEDNDELTYGFVSDEYTVSEAVGSFQLCVVLYTNISIETVLPPFTLRFHDITSKGGSDYVEVNTSFILVETESWCTDIEIIDDHVSETDETFEVLLLVVETTDEFEGLRSRIVLQPHNARVTIRDDDVLMLGLEIAAVFPEDAGVAQAFITFSTGFATGFTITISTLEAHSTYPLATANADYGQLSIFLFFAEDTSVDPSLRRAVNITITDDQRVEELREGFTVEIGLPPGPPAPPAALSIVGGRQESAIEDNDVVTIGFDPVTVSANETMLVLEFSVSIIDGFLDRSVEVTFFTLNGTALAGLDFRDPGEIPLRFDSTATAQTVRITIIDDAILEANENFFGRLVTTDAAVNVDPSQAEATIIEDNDEVTIGFRPTDYSALESQGTVDLTVEVISGTLDRNVEISFYALDGTATGGVDFTTPLGGVVIQFSPSQLSVDVPVTILDDSIVEANENFFGLLTNPVGEPVNLNPDRTTVNINDIDDTVTIGFEETTYTTEEGTTVEVCAVIVSGMLEREAVVTLTSRDGSAEVGADYTAVSSDLVFSETVSRVCRNVSTEEDDTLEGDEQFLLDLTTSDPSVQLNPNVGTVTITDDGILVGFTETEQTREEGRGFVDLCVEVIEGSLETEIEMTLTTTDGTARAPDDYTAVVEVFTLSGEGVRCVNITVRDDDRLERDEVFYANLSTDAHNIFLHRAVAQIVILDDDDATIRFTSEEYVVFESDGTVMLTVVISSGELGRDIHIRVQTISVTAQDPQDYTGLDRTVIFNETVRSISIAVTVQDDNVVEEDERFFAFLHCERNIAVALDPVQTSITIIDDDSVTIGLESTELIISEDDGNITICTTIEDGVLGRQVEVSYSTEDGSAAAPGDYLHASGTLVWNEELYRHCVDIQIEDDLTAEHLEQFSLVLSTSDADVVLEPAIGAIFIQDNDVTDCPLDSSGGILWPRTGPGATRRRECSQVGVGIFQAGPVLRRQCSDLGSWTAADFTVCTVNTRTSDPVLLLWTVVEEITPERRATMFEEEQAVAELFEMFNITYASLVVTVEPFPPLREIVSITAILSPATVISSSLDEFLSFVVHDLDHLGRYTVSGDERGSLRIIPSDTCQCASSKEEPFPLLYLCRGTRTGPCDCVGENSCSCKSPYVGDGTNCTLDRDGDGFPDTPLATCSNSSVEDYCIQDVCPDVSNADQDPVACQNETTEETFDGCPYGRDSVWDVTWANTKRGETSTQPCPGGPNAIGMATRVCGEDGQWAGPPNVLECQSVQFIELEEQIDDLVTATRPEPLIQAITSELSSATSPTDGVPLLPLDLNTTNLLTTTLLDVSEARNLSVDESLLQVFDNVLNDMNSNGWSGLQTMGAGSQAVLENVERYGLLLAQSDGDTERVLSRPNIVMQTMQFVRGRNTSLEFPQTEDLVNYTTSGSDAPPARVEIPPDFLEQIFMDKGGSVPVVNVLFRNLERFLPTSSEQTQGVSSVISVQVGSRSGVSTSVTDDPIRFFFTFDGGEANLNYRCVFWNFSQPVGSGHWASVGLQMVGTTADGNVTTIQCDTTHLTSFAVLVGSDTETSAAEAEALRTVSYLGCAISVACLTLTVLFFVMQRKKLLTTFHYFIHLNLAIALLLGYLLFLAGIETATENEVACTIVAAFLQYFFLAAFCWMLCEGIYLFVMLVLVFSTLPRRWWLFLLLGWVTPIPIVAIGVGIRHDYYGVRDGDDLEVCWLSTEKGTVWGFVGPMLLIIMFNVVFFVLAVRALWRNKRSQQARSPETVGTLQLARTLLQGVVILLPLLGLTWAFGVLTLADNTSAFAWLFTIFNSLQGLAIFILHVIRNEKVWNAIGSKFSSIHKMISVSTSGKYDVSTTQTSLSASAHGRKDDLKQSMEKSSTVEMDTLPSCLDSVATQTKPEELDSLEKDDKTPEA